MTPGAHELTTPNTFPAIVRTSLPLSKVVGLIRPAEDTEATPGATPQRSASNRAARNGSAVKRDSDPPAVPAQPGPALGLAVVPPQFRETAGLTKRRPARMARTWVNGRSLVTTPPRSIARKPEPGTLTRFLPTEYCLLAEREFRL
jgi:hypothetical protein